MDLVDKLQKASEKQQREASLVACRFGLLKAELEAPFVDAALETIRSGQSLSIEQKAKLKEYAAQLDETYFQLQAASDEGRVSRIEYLKTFAQARAVSALIFAGDGDALKAAAEAIYEAAATGEDPVELISQIEAVLK